MNPSAAPNILFIMVDELAPQVLPAYGHPLVRAPHLTQLAQRSVVFDAAYTNSPLCAPARASMLCGRFTPGIAAWDNGAELASDQPTMAHFLRAKGYSATLAGKMHFIGPDQLHGYETRLTTDIYPADFSWTANWSRPPTEPNAAGVSMRPVIEAGPCLRNLQIDYDEEVQFQAKQWLWNRARQRTNEKPFFLTVSYTHPHPPFDAQQAYWDLYRNDEIDLPRVPAIAPEHLDPGSLGLYYNHRRNLMPVSRDHIIAARRAYYAMVSWVDARIGELLDTLKATGLDDNTLIVFTGDHGEMLGERGMWFKMCMYEWSVRVPLMVCWPGRLAPRRVAANVSLVDLLPTLLDYAGGAAPPVELTNTLSGRSLRRLLESGVDDAWSDRAISDFTAGGVPGPLRMVKSGDWKLIRIGQHPPLLFNLADDPDELHDRAADPSAQQALQHLLSINPDGYDPALIDEAVRASQRRRLLIRDVQAGDSLAPKWNWQTHPDDDHRFVRGGGLENGEHATKARARFPSRDEDPNAH
jgi:choline-sulfatase